MLGDIQATLYDTFGYLLPGGVFLAALAILFWALYMPQVPLVLAELSVPAYIALLVLAYFLGHLNQALGNMLVKLLRPPEEAVLSKGQPESMPYDLVQLAQVKASEMLGVDLKEMSPEWLFRICDETMVQRGSCTDREVYQYREGFYRGVTISLLVLAMALIVRAVIPGTSLRIATSVQVLSTLTLLFFIFLSIAGAWLTFRRYRRFSRYRVTHAILGFLVLQEQKQTEK